MNVIQKHDIEKILHHDSFEEIGNMEQAQQSLTKCSMHLDDL